MGLDNYKESLESKLRGDFRYALHILEDAIEEVKKNNLQNEQWFLDSLDKLNSLSVSW